MTPPRTILCLNAGSSSLKFSVFTVDGGTVTPSARGAVEGIGRQAPQGHIVHGECRLERTARGPDFETALEAAFGLLDAAGVPAPDAVGHRLVHGGPTHDAPLLVTDALVEELTELVAWAPLHLPWGLRALAAARERYPGVAQIACFDTAFHRTLPEVARRLPIPESLHHAGLRRYGFHGLSYEHVMSVLGGGVPARVVIAHLGSGSSLVAVKEGKAVDTTMGFTPAGGVPMGTRSGDLDPGVLTYLARVRGYLAQDLERLVERESGLVAVGGSPDMKTLLERAPTDERARLAVELYCYSVRKAIGALAAALGGLDSLVFTGGIGEHSAAVRTGIGSGLGWLGVDIDEPRNAQGCPTVSRVGARVSVRVVPTDEERVVAEHTVRLLGRLG